MLDAPSSPPARRTSPDSPTDPGQAAPRRLGGVLLLAGTVLIASLAAVGAAVWGPIAGLFGMFR
jgi:hypothetical protein